MRSYRVLLVVALLAGCGSPPTHFYTLAAAPGPAAPAGSACGGPPVAVRRVLLPGVLDREAVVRARGTESVEISDQDRWAAPLDGMIQRVLAEDLRLRLPSNRVLLAGDPSPTGGADGLTVSIQRFAGDATGTVMLQADWSLARPTGSIVLTRSETIEVRAGSAETPDVVAAMNRALGTLADRIGFVLAGCPR